MDKSVYKSNLEDKKNEHDTILWADDWTFFLNSEGAENFARSINSQDTMQIEHYAWN